MRKFKCDVCGQDVKEMEIGKLVAELQVPGLMDICTTCSSRVNKAQGQVQVVKTKELVEPELQRVRAAELRVRTEFVLPAAAAEIEAIRGECQGSSGKGEVEAVPA